MNPPRSESFVRMSDAEFEEIAVPIKVHLDDRRWRQASQNDTYEHIDGGRRCATEPSRSPWMLIARSSKGAIRECSDCRPAG